MNEPTPQARPEHHDDGFEMLLRRRLDQLADHAPTTVHSLDEIRVLHHSRPSRRDGRHRRTAGIGATIAALVGAIGFTTVALSGAGTVGAASPEDAVRDFLSASADEDILGMVELLDPMEVPAARAAIEEGRAGAVEAGLIGEGFSLDGLDGLDVSFAELDLVTETLDDGLAVVTASAGSASWTFDPAQFPFGQQLREAFGDGLALTTDTAPLDDLVSPAMMATVERDGRWYVSVGFTIAEYARQAAGLPLPSSSLTAVGAETPEAAADEFFANLISLDLPGAFATAAPGEGDVMLRYAPLLISEAAPIVAEYRADGFDLQLSGTGYSVAGGGDRRKLSAEAFIIAGTVPQAEVYGYYDPTLPTVLFSYDGSAIAVIDAGVPIPETISGLEFDSAFIFPDGDWNQTSVDAAGTVIPLPTKPELDGPDDIEIRRADGCTTWSGAAARSTFGPGFPGFEQLDDQTWRSCAPDPGAFGLLSLLGTSGLPSLPSIEVVELDGRWYVSPIGTLADVVLDLIGSVRDSGSLLDSPVAWFVLGTDRVSLEAMLVGAEIEQLTVECRALVESNATTVTGLRSGVLDLGAVRACATSTIYSEGYVSSAGDGTTFLPAVPASVAVDVPASTNPP